MITDFDDFCLWVYGIVDEIYQAIEPMLGLHGPRAVCSNSELMAMSIIGECRGWDLETNLLSEMQAHRDLFPHIPEQSRFNRRWRNLMGIVNLIRQTLVSQLDVAQDSQCVIDSLPVPRPMGTRHFHLAPSSTADWPAHGADFGKVPSKKQTIFGYKLHLLITMGGVILDFELAGASIDEREVAVDLLSDPTDLDVIGDKGYVSQDKAAQLWRHNRVRLRTLPKRNQKQQLPPETRRLFNSVRQIIETVNAQLTEHFHLETNHAHTFWGLGTRLYTKLTAYTLCIYLNRLFGNADFLQIKHLAFPI